MTVLTVVPKKIFIIADNRTSVMPLVLYCRYNLKNHIRMIPSATDDCCFWNEPEAFKKNSPVWGFPLLIQIIPSTLLTIKSNK